MIPKSKTILIVGGGFTGLTAAYRLSKSGKYAITLVEKAEQLGGLTAGFEIAGTSLEKTYHYLFTTDDHIVSLVEELGLSDKLFWAETSNAILFEGVFYPFTCPLDILRFSPCTLRDRIRLGFTILYLQRCKKWRQFCETTAVAWMRKVSGKSAMRVIWNPLLNGKFGKYYGSVSMAWLWARIHSRANSRRSGREQLGYFRGGFPVITDAIERELKSKGVIVKTNAVVEEFCHDERAAIVNGVKESFDYCVFTGPSTSFTRILKDRSEHAGYIEKLAEIDYLGAVCMVFSSNQDLGDYYWVNVNESDAPFLVFINHSHLVGKELYGGMNVYYIGAYLPTDSPIYRSGDEELEDLWFSYLKKMFPEFDSTKVDEKEIFRFSEAQHVVDTQYERKIPAYRTPLPGVLLANYSQIFPEDRGTNFAVREGEKIADMIMAESVPEDAAGCKELV